MASGSIKRQRMAMAYIEPTFTNGVATYDMTQNIASEGLSGTLLNIIVQFSSKYVNTGVGIRSCDVSGNIVTIACTSASFSGKVGCYTVFLTR